jgi:hypothetical protein
MSTLREKQAAREGADVDELKNLERGEIEPESSEPLTNTRSQLINSAVLRFLFMFKTIDEYWRGISGNHDPERRSVDLSGDGVPPAGTAARRGASTDATSPIRNQAAQHGIDRRQPLPVTGDPNGQDGPLGRGCGTGAGYGVDFHTRATIRPVTHSAKWTTCCA